MERKIFQKKMTALLIVVMTISILPMNILASSQNKLTNSLKDIPEKTVLVEDAVISNQQVDGNDDIIYVANGTDLVIELDDPMQPGDTFTLELKNAVWFFRSDMTHVTSPGALLGANPDLANLWKCNYARTDYNFESTAIGWETENATEKWSTENTTFGETYNTSEGVWGYNTRHGGNDSAVEGTYFRTYTGSKEIPYALVVSPLDDASATVTILADDNGDGYVDGNGDGIDDTPRVTYDDTYRIRIPIVSRTLGFGDVLIQIIPDGTSISPSTFVVALDTNVNNNGTQTSVGGTTTSTTSTPSPTKTPTTPTTPTTSPVEPTASGEYTKAPLMQGDPNGNFRPKDNITRGEMAQVINNLMYNGKIAEDAPFTDVDQNMWYANAVNFVYAEGYMVGYPGGMGEQFAEQTTSPGGMGEQFAEQTTSPGVTFHPDAPITRAEVLVILNNIMEYPQYEGEPMFNDISEHWAYESINNGANALGLSGFPDGSFRPDDNITRGDFAIILAKATDRTDYAQEFIPNDVYVDDYYYEYVLSVVNYSNDD